MNVENVVGVILAPRIESRWEPVELASAPPTATPAPPPEEAPEESQPVVDVAVIAAVAAALLTGGPDLHLGVAAKLITAGFSGPVAAGVAEMVTPADPVPPARPSNVAARRTARTNALRAAQTILAGATRVAAAIRAGIALSDALAREHRYWAQHRAAAAHRHEAAGKVDAAAAASPLLRWRTVLDGRTTPDCARLDGTLFDVRRPPGGVYPGQQHPACRCTAIPVRRSTELSNPQEPAMPNPRHAYDPTTGDIVDYSGPVPVVVHRRRDSLPARRRPMPHDVVPIERSDDDLYGPEALEPTPDTLGMIKYLRENNPYMFAGGPADIPAAIERARRATPRVGTGFDAAGQRGWHNQMPVNGYEDPDLAFRRDGESEDDRLDRVAGQHALSEQRRAMATGRTSREEAADYMRRMGLT